MENLIFRRTTAVCKRLWETKRRMAHRFQVTVALALILGPILGGTLPAAADGPSEIIVQPAPSVSIDAINLKYGTRTLFRFTDSAQVLLTTPSLAATLTAMLLDPLLIVWAEPNSEATAVRATDGADAGADPCRTQVLLVNGAGRYDRQWGVPKTSLDSAHRLTQGAGQVIAVLDTKVDGSHPELSGKTLAGIDVVGSDPQVNRATLGKDRGHGTMVAGVALRAAPQAKVLPVRVLNEDGVGSVATVAEGIRRVAANGGKIINLSLSTMVRSRAMEDAVHYAQSRGSTLVAAYGNEALNSPEVYPADFAGVISVVATDEDDRVASCSNYGRPASTAAPGVGVVAPTADHQYAIAAGTSFATPFVSGQAALLRATGVAPGQASSRIISTGDDISQANGGIKPGFGRINAKRSLGGT
jgi:thermitase